MFKPMFALHKDANGDVLAASSFTAEYQLSSWLREREFRAGDNLEFKETAVRAEFDEVDPAPPAFIETPPTPAPEPADADQPF